MVKSAITRFFDDGVKKVPSFGKEIDPVVQEYMKGVEVVVRCVFIFLSFVDLVSRGLNLNKWRYCVGIL